MTKCPTLKIVFDEGDPSFLHREPCCPVDEK